MDGLVFSGKVTNKICNPHKHDFWEVVYYAHGSGVLHLNDELYEFKPGDVICVPPKTIHYEETDGMYTDYFMLISHFENSKNEIPMYKESKKKEFLFLFDQIYTIYNSDYLQKTDILKSLLEALEKYFIMHDNKINTKDKNVEKIIDKIIKNINNPFFDLSEEIKKIYMHPTNFRRLFKQETGLSPHRYLNEKRLESALRLIKTSYPSSLSIKQISQICGFADPYYFSRLYKKYIGHSPTANDDKTNFNV